jgi:transitional endoplasmic reticulum ATPase
MSDEIIKRIKTIKPPDGLMFVPFGSSDIHCPLSDKYERRLSSPDSSQNAGKDSLPMSSDLEHIEEDMTGRARSPRKKKAKHKGNGQPEERDLTDIIAEFGGDEFKIPEGMDFDDAIQVLTKQKEEEGTTVSISETIRAFPLDGAVAFANVLKDRFGWTELRPGRGFWGPTPPTLVGVDIGHNETMQVPWGSCSVPKIDGTLETSYDVVDGLPVFQIRGTVKRKHERIVAEIAQQVRERVKEDSIYQGQAIKINLRDSEGDVITNFGPDFAPRFMNTDEMDVSEIVYSETTGKMLQVNVFNPVQKAEKCRKNRIPLKRGILLEGPFGTGKTLTADLIAMMCVENGWTFMYLQDARDLQAALGLAAMYAPCVLFAEDIDKITSGGRTTEMDALFNAMDGVDSKGREVMTVLTTNAIQNIHAGFIRPGRIDTVISVTPPDAPAIAKLVKLYGCDEDGNQLVTATEGAIEEALKGIEGVNAAFIREVVERAKLAALDHEGDKLEVDAKALSDAAETLAPHIKLLYPHIDQKKFDTEEVEEHDPLAFGFGILTQKVAEAVLDQVTDPKFLHKIVTKKMKRQGRGPMGGPSLN